MILHLAPIAALLSESVQSGAQTGDIILRCFIGMVFIMLLMVLAAVVTGAIGRHYEKRHPAADPSDLSDPASAGPDDSITGQESINDNGDADSTDSGYPQC